MAGLGLQFAFPDLPRPADLDHLDLDARPLRAPLHMGVWAYGRRRLRQLQPPETCSSHPDLGGRSRQAPQSSAPPPPIADVAPCPPSCVALPSPAQAGTLTITYLDDDIRIARGNRKNLFVLTMADPDVRPKGCPGPGPGLPCGLRCAAMCRVITASFISL